MVEMSPNLVLGGKNAIINLGCISKGHLKYFQLLTYEVLATSNFKILVVI